MAGAEESNWPAVDGATCQSRHMTLTLTQEPRRVRALDLRQVCQGEDYWCAPCGRRRNPTFPPQWGYSHRRAIMNLPSEHQSWAARVNRRLTLAGLKLGQFWSVQSNTACSHCDDARSIYSEESEDFFVLRPFYLPKDLEGHKANIVISYYIE